MTPEQEQARVENIRRIASLEELDGYEAEARKRGLTTKELPELHIARKRLTPKQKGRRR